ncbi:MAG: acetylglutamate kinase [Bacteroidales bacterium]|nr:acetylglutamate kinase [Bacteroidales bacterium]MDD4361514.1 acetylglutamate kinase [Bacteroidales bacterium]MDD4429904.1 acetylglutamate kinase [Bacteroidales bacterium]
MDKVNIIKVGGKIVEDPAALEQFLQDFAKISGHKLLVHGGGTLATELAEKLGIENKMTEGRRITDAETLKIVTMVYGGLINKNIVARLQAKNINALGLTGADLNLIRSGKRPVKEIDYGYVGDVQEVQGDVIADLLKLGIVPVLAPITHDKKGQLLNTNADTIAAETAKALAGFFEVHLIYCFEKKGVLMNPEDENSLISEIDSALFKEYVEQGIIQGGMIPKLQNAFDAIRCGVKDVTITKAQDILLGRGSKIIQ